MNTISQEDIDLIVWNYRAAKSSEAARIAIDQKLIALVRVYGTDWSADQDEKQRKEAATQARRVVETVRADTFPDPRDVLLCKAMADIVNSMHPAWAAFENARKQHRKDAEKLAKKMPAWAVIGEVRGFSAWGLVTLIGEAGNLSNYSGCRKLYKRLGLAPDECYPKGERSTGRMIPRSTRGRIMGIIADALLRAQWRGEKEDVPAHAIGPYGEVYRSVKQRHLAAGKPKGHADKLARRAMTKALIHDVHRAWHGQPLDYVGSLESQGACDSQRVDDLQTPPPSVEARIWVFPQAAVAG